MLKSLQKNLTYIDVFGKPVTLTINQNQQQKTLLGGIVTIAMFFIFFYLLIDQCVSALSQTNPQTISSVLHNQVGTLKNLTFADNPLMFGIQNDKYSFVKNNSLFTAQLQQCNKDKDGNYDCKDIPLADCDLAQYTNTTWYEFYSNIQQIPHQFCPDYQWYQNNVLQLQGFWELGNFKYLYLTFQFCKNETSNNTCGTQQEMNNLLNGGYFSIDMFNQFTDLKKTGDPYVNQGLDKFFSINSNQLTTVDVYLKEVQTITDKGFLTVDDYQSSSLQFDSTNNYNSYITQNKFLAINFRYSHTMIKNYRSYTKFQQILGSIGGLWWVLQVIAKIILNPVSSFIFYLKIGNQAFSFEQLDQQNQNSTIKVQNKDQINDSKSIQRQITKTFKLKLNKLNLNIFEYFKSKFVPQPKRSQYDFIKTKIKDQLDIQFILVKMQEIDKLKTLLLDQEQFKLFDFFAKPLVPIKTNDDFIYQKCSIEESNLHFYNMAQKSIAQKENEGKNAFQQVHKRISKSEVDRKLLKLIDARIACYYEEKEKQLISLPSDRQAIQSERNDEKHELDEKGANFKMPYNSPDLKLNFEFN